MVESLKLFVRTYVYWVGLILGFAIVPGSLLFTAEVAPVNTPLWLAPFAGLLLFVIDRPSTWEPPLWRALLIRVLGAGFAATMLIAFDAVASTHYGSQHWSETLLSFGLGWIVFTVVAGHMLMSLSLIHISERLRPIWHTCSPDQGRDPYLHDMDRNLLRDFLYPRRGTLRSWHSFDGSSALWNVPRRPGSFDS